MPQVQLQRYEQILDRAISRVVARSDLSDVADSAAFKNVLAAFAREIDEAYFQMTRLTDLFSIDRAAGEDLDERAKEIQPGTITRTLATTSTGTLRFSRVGTSGDVTIPAGTVGTTSDGISARSTQQAIILDTQNDSNDVNAAAVQPGENGNVAAGTIVKFGSKIPGVDTITNPTAFTGGVDQESDVSFRARLKAFVSTLSKSTPEALEFVALGVVDTVSGSEVVFSHLFEDPVDPCRATLYIDDGTGTAETTTAVVGESVLAAALGGEEFLFLDNFPVKSEATFTVYKNAVPMTLGVDVFLNEPSGRLYFTPPLALGDAITADYTYFTGLIEEVQKVIDGDPNDRENFPGWRAGGVTVRVLAPVVVAQTVTGVLTLLDGFDRPTVIANVETAILDYINTLGISGDVIRNEIIERIMAVAGVFDVNLTVPATNNTILDNEIARSTTSDLNIS